jgi:hypothetical protein
VENENAKVKLFMIKNRRFSKNGNAGGADIRLRLQVQVLNRLFGPKTGSAGVFCFSLPKDQSKR